jgi:uncharacterized protein YegJ (DUF2314 family)
MTAKRNDGKKTDPDTMSRDMHFPTRPSLVPAAVFFAMCALGGGCQKQESPATQPVADSATSKPSLWRRDGQTTIVAVRDEAKDAQLRAAIDQARQTAEDARKQWTYAGPDDQKKWAVKWAAPLAGTTDDQTEQVWVEPVNWSPFRIEGVLASKPISALACGRTLGELVSFPIEELTDWLHEIPDPASTADSGSRYEGGFTLKVLEERFGTPRTVAK